VVAPFRLAGIPLVRYFRLFAKMLAARVARTPQYSVDESQVPTTLHTKPLFGSLLPNGRNPLPLFLIDALLFQLALTLRPRRAHNSCDLARVVLQDLDEWRRARTLP